jgi:hypothetical protein
VANLQAARKAFSPGSIVTRLVTAKISAGRTAGEAKQPKSMSVHATGAPIAGVPAPAPNTANTDPGSAAGNYALSRGLI